MQFKCLIQRLYSQQLPDVFIVAIAKLCIFFSRNAVLSYNKKDLFSSVDFG